MRKLVFFLTILHSYSFTVSAQTTISGSLYKTGYTFVGWNTKEDGRALTKNTTQLWAEKK